MKHKPISGVTWGIHCDKDYGLELCAPWVSIAPPVLWLFLPWVWVCLDIRRDGGFWLEILNPREIGGFGPRLIAQGGIRGRGQWEWRDER